MSPWAWIVLLLGIFYWVLGVFAIAAWHRDLTLRKRIVALEEAIHRELQPPELVPPAPTPLDELERSMFEHPAAGVRKPPRSAPEHDGT